MSKIEKSIEVDAPIRAVYNQWTQFEEFPRFMQGIKQVQQKDDVHLHWCAEIGGKEVEWDAEIVDQIPDQCISWRSTSGRPNAGTVRFEKIDENRTRVHVAMEMEPQGAVENVGDKLGVPSHRVEGDLKRFKEFIERMGHETGSWRGEVHAGRRSSKDDSSRGGMGTMSSGAATHTGIGSGSSGMAGTSGGTGGASGMGGGLGGSTTGTGGTGGGMTGARGGASSGSGTTGGMGSDVGAGTPGGSGGTATGMPGDQKKGM